MVYLFLIRSHEAMDVSRHSRILKLVAILFVISLAITGAVVL